MTDDLPLSQPCNSCRAGVHHYCEGGGCGCLADHRDDDEIMRGFKAIKRRQYPEREAQVWRGWE